MLLMSREHLPRRIPGSILAACLVISVACGRGVLEESRESSESLARAVIDAVARADRNALRGLALSEHEFAGQVWPELPASRPERNLPLDYVWTDLRTRSDASLAQTLQAYGGQTYDLVGVSFAAETTQYKTFLVHREAVLTVRDSTGQHQRIRLFGSVIEKNGRFKIFSYVVD